MMLLNDLTLPDGIRVLGTLDRTVNGVSLDSRTVGPGFLYAALPGANVHGASFAAPLVAQGLRAVLTDEAGLAIVREAAEAEGISLADVTFLVIEEPRAHLGGIAAQVYGTDPVAPSLLGITGTNGKTTTTYLVDGLLRALGRTTGVIGTVATLIAGERLPSARTTPEAPELHSLLARMRARGVDDCAMEVSSHALHQHRVDGVFFDVVGFTNLTQDHLDYHPTMRDYFEAKALLFTPRFARTGAIVLADDWARELAAEAPIPVVTISREESDRPDWHVTGESGSDFVLVGPAGERIVARSPLPGDFNVMNTALALVLLVLHGVAPEDLAPVAASFDVAVPGRMEVVHPEAPRAVVDYSHTSDALEKVLHGLRESSPLVVVFGAGGDRDPLKRPLMGAAAARHADVIIVTDDNPRSEDPATIRAAVLLGVQAEIAAGNARVRSTAVHEIGDRAAAIAAGVEAAGASGTLLVAGKGHETGQTVGNIVHPFDDREQTRAAIAHVLSR